MRDNTRLTHGFKGADPDTGAISFPIYQSATFRHHGVNKSTGYDYSRAGNPTREELEKTLAALEEGLGCRAFSSGMAAISTVFKLLKPGQHVILSEDLYGGTYRLAHEVYEPYGIEFEYLDTTNLETLSTRIKPNTAMIFIETPSNPMMKVTDIAGVKALTADKAIFLVVDNTFLTPIFQKPLTLGADMVVYSGTKYLCGHNDVLAGFVVCNYNQVLMDRIDRLTMSEGAILSAFDSWLMLRSLKTLSVRLLKQEENAKALAHWLSHCPQVKEVLYVGLEDFPGFALNQRQAKGSGAMISFKVSSPELAIHILEHLDLIYFAESLGGVESLITYPYLQTHKEVPDVQKDKLGLDDRLLRLSVGLEDVLDLEADLEQAFSSYTGE